MKGAHEADIDRLELRFSCGAGHLTANQVIRDQRTPCLLVYAFDRATAQGQLRAEHRLLKLPVVSFDLPAALVAGHDISWLEAAAPPHRSKQHAFAPARAPMIRIARAFQNSSKARHFLRAC